MALVSREDVVARIKYLWDTSRLEFEVAKSAVPKVDDRNVQKVDPFTGWPVWSVELTAWLGEDEGSESLAVSVASATRPELHWRQPVELVDCEMLPWSTKGRRDGEFRSGVAFRAKEIRPVNVTALPAAA